MQGFNFKFLPVKAIYCPFFDFCIRVSIGANAFLYNFGNFQIVSISKFARTQYRQ